MVDFVIRTVKRSLHTLEAGRFYARAIGRKLVEDDVLFLASGLAFNGILTLIPMLFLSAAAVGTILNSYVLSMQQLNEILDTIFPRQPFAVEIKTTIRSIIADIVTYRRSFGIFGFLVLLWTTTSLFDALRSALHRIYELKRTRGLLASLAHDIGFIALAFVLFLATNFAIWVYMLITPLAMNVPALKPLVEAEFTRAVPTMIIVLLTAVMFYIVYRHMTDVKPPSMAAAISTLTTTILWVLAGRLFAVYISDWSVIGKIYGPYAFLLVLLIWIYLSSLLFVFGGIVGQVYWKRREER
ncbi:MAG: YihY/virulence factor BrkB family protein [Bacteroidota bacterium]